jgi:hypothetical protein
MNPFVWRREHQAGAFATGRLTCLVIDDDNRGHFLFTA